MTRHRSITMPGVLLLVAVCVIGLRLVAFGFVPRLLALVPMIEWAVSVAMRGWQLRRRDGLS